MRSLLRSILAEPPVADPPARVWRDWALLAVLVPTAVLEAAFRPDVPWRWASLAVTLVLLPVLLWRRSHPLAAMSVAFGGMLGLSIAQLVAGLDEMPGLYAMAAIVLTLYTVARWASGRDVLVGCLIALATSTVAVVADYTGVADTIGGYTLLGIIVAVGLAVRFLGRARHRELEQVRSAEREHIARDLHDTVAHHVSAIAIRAQAGLAVAPDRPEAALDALRVIETEASRTLSEMRAMVGVLRRDGPAELAPPPTLADLDRIALAAGPPVRLELSGDLRTLPPALETAVFRLVQESVTNARRHARRATAITVALDADDHGVDLRVTDDGDPVDGRAAAVGYGIVGMIERADLLGGTCEAGPAPHGGWEVRARLPRSSVLT